ncbi:uncharacterized protein BT62DRAFT_420374 [Guyanagaster necrorhizus]|uniref:Uncharacterized protein n=1 Tax=Guyanagaster necrorhizus TaxID=856835 RepID=A0A9P7W390_9AGAR|nr:uncharacterized protein BT62DRAFT_420374 [Guyanagaster necrorhizus MCA 3950]KAG7451373.1 hypothetical protein BT62DRAFT_420374 [Guyanagaster necrorhizus MCA 3950]
MYNRFCAWKHVLIYIYALGVLTSVHTYYKTQWLLCMHLVRTYSNPLMYISSVITTCRLFIPLVHDPSRRFPPCFCSVFHLSHRMTVA